MNAGYLGGYSLKRANSQEPKSETSHSCLSNMNAVTEQGPSGNTGSSKSAAMLGLALSFGASGVLFADSEATAAVGAFVNTTSAASSESPQLPSVLQNRLDQPSSTGQGLAMYHTVEHGDSLWQIAQEHRVEIKDIKTANRISPDEPLQVGQVIKVPSEQAVQPTLVSLLPGVQSTATNRAQKPTLEDLVAGIPTNTNFPVIESIEQAEAPTNVEEPAVVAVENLTGDVSLRSAGLVSQSDGFQADLQKLASNQQISDVRTREVVETDLVETDLAASSITQSDVVNDIQPEVEVNAANTPEPSSSTDAIDTAYQAYEVRKGDTIGNIAVALGTTPEEIANVNGIEDPDFIVEGDTLALPEDVIKELVIEDASVSIAQAAPELATSTSLRSFDGTRLSRLQSTIDNPIDASLTLQRLRSDQAAIASNTANAEPGIEADAVTVDEPYTADLLADVNSAQQLNSSLEAENRLALRQETPPAESIVVNPQFAGGSLEARAISSDDVSQNSELLAAAPLDPSVYVSSPTPVAGQVVSPEMPILPSADEYLPEAPNYFNGYIWPTHGTLTSGYGWRWGRMHRGIDVAGPVGTPIVSAAAGVVETAGWNSGGYGNLVEVRHADGSMTRYAHNSRIMVRSGQRVAQGQHIADMGSTGYSTGPHLHFEVHLPSQGTVNPMAMLPGR
ncbi:peptidoglycan DD-metalloendopeptidase family protein [Leptothoe sp. PORK10 BA2]|uniref:peptidoglycan DD-metalloendopeptidase family protein n=1 Tax=Leptothoe sp. PORK10 BA2 TaxID=3110254 RepID=UPI002B21AE24|nr:peptidoglycan DD-metalloendopeptidase family protein [Leptothoe sp. PORK10 BA2]MEA5462180.1 peptidoglycan DD-metalloendopeptidase family protein [Leptothoe sp. PORK10 BA2]